MKHRLESELPKDLFQNDLQGSASAQKLNKSLSAASLSRYGTTREFASVKREVSRTKKNAPISDALRYTGRAFRRHMSKVPSSLKPSEITYELLCSVIRGTEMPSLHNNLLGKTKDTKVVIKLSCGPFSTCTKPAENRNGVCEFYSLLSLKCFLPSDVEACPDVIICACSVSSDDGTHTPFSYERFRFKDIFRSTADVYWLTLREDKAKDMLGFEMFPGKSISKLQIRVSHTLSLIITRCFTLRARLQAR